MSEDRLHIKLTKRKPHKVYKTNIEVDEHIEQLCKFLRKHKDKKLELIINGKSIKFDSVSGRKKFAAGFEYSFKIIEKYVEEYVNDTSKQIQSLKDKFSSAQHEAKNSKNELKEAIEEYVMKHEVMNLRTAAWKDRIAELEDDREILKAEIERLRKK